MFLILAPSYLLIEGKQVDGFAFDTEDRV